MQDNQTELEPTAAANDTACSCPSARELAVTRFQQARAFAAAKVNQIRKAATEQASTIRDYAQEKGEVIRDKAKKFHNCSCFSTTHFVGKQLLLSNCFLCHADVNFRFPSIIDFFWWA